MSSKPVPCEVNASTKKVIRAYAEELKIQAHTIGEHGLDEEEFYTSGVFRGAIERIRGQFSAEMKVKRAFVAHVLNYLQDREYIVDWEEAGNQNRYDYMVVMPSGKKSAIELKGCLDGNNTNIFERPPQANEFILWSVCTNATSDPRHNVWSGIHTRLSAEIISRAQQVDGLVVWDWVCGTTSRPCPKLTAGDARTVIGQYRLTPPCIYLFPGTIPSPRNNPDPAPQELEQVELLAAFHAAFGGQDAYVNKVGFEVDHDGAETVRTTTIKRGGSTVRKSDPTPIKRK